MFSQPAVNKTRNINAGKPPLVMMPLSVLARGTRVAARVGPSQQVGTSPGGKPPLVVMPLSVLARGTRVATSIGLAPDLYEDRRREWQLALGWLSGMARQLSCSGHHQL